MSRNILAVSWAMPPMLFPRALQISRLFKQWSESGWKTTVLCAEAAPLKDIVLLDDALAAFYESYYTRVPVRSPEGALVLRALFRLAPFLKQMPDERRLWAGAAISKARSLNAGAFSALVSFAQPWSSHLVGLQLQKTTGLPWIAHFSDPWTSGSHIRLSPWAAWQAQAWEKRVVQSADRLVFVTHQAAEATLKKYPGDFKRKVRIVPHGFDRDILSALKPKPAPAPGPTTLVHTGHFYGTRTPWALLDALARINRITPLEHTLHLRFVGYTPPDFLAKAKELGIDALITAIGPKSYLESLQELRDADVLLLIEAGSSNNLYFPSKLVDYFLFQKPIFALTPKRGPSTGLLAKLGGPMAEPDDVDGVERALKDLLGLKQAGRLGVPPVFSETIEPYDIRNTARTFQTLIEEVIRK